MPRHGHIALWTPPAWVPPPPTSDTAKLPPAIENDEQEDDTLPAEDVAWMEEMNEALQATRCSEGYGPTYVGNLLGLQQSFAHYAEGDDEEEISLEDEEEFDEQSLK